MSAGDTDDHQSRRLFDSADLDIPKRGDAASPIPARTKGRGKGRTLHLLPSDATDAEIEEFVRRIKGLDESDPR